MTSEEGVPPALRDRILRDLRPVRPLADPWKRAAALLPLGLALFAAIPARFGLRADAGSLGEGLLWGASLLQLSVGTLIVAWALNEVIPGNERTAAGHAAVLAVGVGLVLIVTLATWYRSPTLVPPRQWNLYWRTCFTTPMLLGLPLLAAFLVVAGRGVLMRPALVGALSGLSTGLMADAGWRTFCEVSDPAHVLTAHAGAILTLTLAGALLTAGFARVRERRAERL